MGLLDFEFLSVTNDTLKDKAWDAVILVCENLNWDAAFNSDLAYLKPAVEDALKVSYVHLMFVNNLQGQQSPISCPHPGVLKQLLKWRDLDTKVRDKLRQK